MGEMDWWVVWRGRHASMAEAHGDGDSGTARLWHVRARETRGGASERVSERALMRGALQLTPNHDVA